MNIENFKRSFENGEHIAVCVQFDNLHEFYDLCAKHNITDSAGCSVYKNRYLQGLAKGAHGANDDPMCFVMGWRNVHGLMVDRRSFFVDQGWHIVDFIGFDEFIPAPVVELNNDRFSETILSSLDIMLQDFQ